MPDTATVTTRPSARSVAVIFPALSISAMSQPPKMSPRGLVSAGIARVRLASPPRGAAAASLGGPARPVPGRSMARRGVRHAAPRVPPPPCRSSRSREERPPERLGTGCMPPRQLGEIHPRDVDVVEITVVELAQLLKRAVVADLPASSEDELAEDIVQIALIKLVQLVERLVVADLLAHPGHDLAKELG